MKTENTKDTKDVKADAEFQITYNEADDGFALFVKSEKFDYTITILNDDFENDGGFVVEYDDNMDKKYVMEIEQHAINVLSHIIDGVLNEDEDVAKE
jgi:hypothetical protein